MPGDAVIIPFRDVSQPTEPNENGKNLFSMILPSPRPPKIVRKDFSFLSET